jgi:plasmid stabilization system protein ParE
MSHRVAFSPEAQRDLDELFEWLADVASVEVASRYVGRIRRSCESLATFPERGTLRSDIRPGIRVIGFERRAVVTFYVRDRTVMIARVLYGGRNIEDHLGPGDG